MRAGEAQGLGYEELSAATVFVRSPYNYDADLVSRETGHECVGDSLTQQHQSEEADINVIVRRFLSSGELPQRTRPPMVGDFAEAPDFRTCMDLMNAARLSFEGLDAKVRYRFHNNPVEFVDFCSDPDNLPELRKLGLAPEKEVADGGSEERSKPAGKVAAGEVVERSEGAGRGGGRGKEGAAGGSGSGQGAA